MKVGQELQVYIEKGKHLILKLIRYSVSFSQKIVLYNNVLPITACDSVGETSADGIVHLQFELNGQPRSVHVKDKGAGVAEKKRLKALKGVTGSVGAAMPGVVLETHVKKGDNVKKGDPLVLMSAMKMETIITSPCDGVVSNVVVTAGDQLEGGDLCLEIDEVL